MFKVCPIENSNEMLTSCVNDMLEGREPSQDCFSVVPRHNLEPQCRVSQTSAGLLVSTELELQTVSTSTVLNGFSGSKSGQKIQPGVSFVGHRAEAVKLKCFEMEFQTASVGDAIEVVIDDLKGQDPILIAKLENSTSEGWKDISIDSILTRLSNSLDAMNSDPSVKPLFNEPRSIAIMVVSGVVVIVVAVTTVACCCGRKILDCCQCFKQTFNCCFRHHREDLRFNPGHPMRIVDSNRQSIRQTNHL